MSDPIALSSDAELRAVVERALSANYEIDREIGRGGMGIVYRAKDRRLKRTVAIKLLPPELAFRREIKSRFLREAETAAQLNHPNVVPIYSVDEREGLVFFVMACVDGSTLAKRLSEVKRFDIEEARCILREVADALAYAHARGVVHRDIKPDNILLEAETGRALVTDFGIARAVQDTTGSRLTATGMAIGTPAYMSPEQAAGDREIDGRSDLYSLGVVGYQLLAGELPFTASSTPAMLMKQITERPVPIEQQRADTPPQLAATVMTLLEKEPDDRFADATTLVQALDGHVAVSPPRGATAAAPVAPAMQPPLPSAPPVAPAQMPDQWERWHAPLVMRFRRRFIPYAFVNSVIVLAAIFTGVNLLGVTVIWSIVLAFQYSKLWSAGYDWRDVFRQPRDRLLADVASETVDEVRAVFDRDRREDRRQRQAQQRAQHRALPAPPPARASGVGNPNPSFTPPTAGPHHGTVQRAAEDLNAIHGLVRSLPKRDQRLVQDMVPAADALYQRIHSLARSLGELERAATPEAAERLEAEIASLEAQANPNDRASESRVRRLALLKRERRALADSAKRREEMTGKLESCRIALENMRVDVVRLRAGGVASATQNITLLTDRARSLADSVDAAVAGADGFAAGARERRPERGRA